MGRLGRSVEKLEALSRERATAAVKEFWDGFLDEEIALLAADHHGISLTPAQEERLSGLKARVQKVRASGMSRVVGLAVGHDALGDEVLLSYRMQVLLETTAFADDRRERIRELVGELKKANGKKEDVS